MKPWGRWRRRSVGPGCGITRGWWLVLLLLSACAAPASPPAPGLYLVQRKAAGSWELVRYVNPTGPASAPLSSDLEGYAVGPHLALLTAQSIALADGSRLETLHTCAAPCRALSWSADGAWLAWVEENEDTEAVWLWSREQGARASGLTTVGEPAWSPVQATLAVPQATHLVLLDAGTGISRTLDYAVRGKPAWAPDGTRVALLLASGDVALITLDPFAASGLYQPPDYFVQREALAWSPDGRWLAVTERRFILLEHGAGDAAHVDWGGSETLGPQAWLYPLDGGVPIPLPGDPAAAFVRPAWSPDGRYLALARLPIGQMDPRPEVWVYALDPPRLEQVIPNAAAPTWR